MHIQKFIVLILVAVSSVLMGCDQLQSSTGSSSDALILDMTAIVRATGKDEQINNQMQAANQELEKQLVAIAKDLNEQLADAKAKIGDKPTLEQEQELKQLSAQANQKMNEMRQRARQKSQEFQGELVRQLRDQVRPLSEMIAKKRGAKAVLLISEPILWFDSSIDITADVIAAIRATPV